MLSNLAILSTYVPATVLTRIALDPQAFPRVASEAIPGVILSADISGFTTLTETLARAEGSAGAGKITELLNTYLDKLIAIFHRHGGDVVKFAGDGLQALWSADVLAENETTLATRAAQCGLEIQQKLHEIELAPGLKVSLRIGIGAGLVANSHVGGILRRWEFILSGAPLEDATRADRAALPGEVHLSLATFRLLEGRCRATRKNDTYQLHEVLSPLMPVVLVAPSINATMEPAILSYVSGTVLGRPELIRSGWEAEMRPVSVMFVRIASSGAEIGLAEVQRLMQEFQNVLYQHEGTMNKINVDDQGFVMLAAWGLPPLAHSDDAVRAVKAAMQFHPALRAGRIFGSIGIASGIAFCGSVGCARRREYTLIGNTVNLAARLMQGTREDILCDENTQHAARDHIAFRTDLPPRRLKGFPDPVPVFQPVGRVELPPLMDDFIGRKAERRQLAESLYNLIRGGRGRTILLEGDAGIGKTRLALHLASKASDQGVQVFSAEGNYISRTTPYYIWKPLFASLFSPSHVFEGPERRLMTMEQAIAEDESLSPLRPLLNQVLPDELPDTPLTASLTPDVRADNTRLFLLAVLKTYIKLSSRRVLIVFDDAHWQDSSSLALCRLLHRHLTDVLLLLVTRTLQENRGANLRSLLRDEGCEHLHLDGLSDSDSHEFLRHKLGVPFIPDAIQQVFRERAAGNPLFIEELANALQQRGLVRTHDNNRFFTLEAGDLEHLELPYTIYQAVISRIDQLSLAESDILKCASVIGRSFEQDLLHAILPIEEERARLSENMKHLEALGITLQQPNGDRPIWVFRHALFQEAAYNLLGPELKRSLHLRISGWYETTSDDLAPVYPLLAFHSARAEDHEKAILYLEKAGKQAFDNGAYQEATRYFERVLQTDQKRRQKADAPTRASWEYQLGEANCGLGHHSRGRDNLLQSLSLLATPFPLTKTGMGSALASQLLQHTWFILLRHLTGRSLPVAGERKQLLLRAYQRLAQSFYFSNKAIQTLLGTYLSLNVSQRLGPSPELCVDLADAALCSGLIGFHRLADYYTGQARNAAASIDDASSRAWVLMVAQGLYRIGVGQWGLATHSLTEARDIYHRLLDRRRHAEALALLAVIHFHKGRSQESMALWDEVQQGARLRGDPQNVLWGLVGRLENLLRAGALDTAPILVKEIETQLDSKFGISDVERIWAAGSLAMCHLRLGQTKKALEAATRGVEAISSFTVPMTIYVLDGFSGTVEALLRMRDADHDSPRSEAIASLTRRAMKGMSSLARAFPISRPRVFLWRGLHHWNEGAQVKAHALWRRSLALAEQLDMPYDIGRAHFEIGSHLPEGDPSQDTHMREARRVLDRIGAAMPT